MIVVQLFGGLGNQLFQYAIGRRLAHDYGVSLKLDISAFERYSLRQYGLGNFNIQHNIASNDEIWHISWLSPRTKRILERKISQRILPLRKQKKVVCETEYHFYEPVLHSGSNIYLEGYWQNENYFKSIEAIIRDEFVVTAVFDERNREMANRISASNSVSLHIRRGDYASNQAIREAHGLLGLDYYHDAVSQISNQIPNPQFFIFSDDPEWAKANLHINYPVYLIDFNKAEKDYEDLRLMSMCKHHIVANSSFSWWGAWLSKNEEKKVFAPRKWFNNPGLSEYEIIPKSWKQL